jgi:hypothetical protein
MPDLAVVEPWLNRPKRHRSRRCNAHQYVRGLKWGEHFPEVAKPMVVSGGSVNQHRTAIRRWAIGMSAEPVPEFVHAWCQPSLAPEFTSAIDELRSVIKAIGESRPLPEPTAEMDQLLTRALQERGVRRDIREWANRLSADIRDLTD